MVKPASNLSQENLREAIKESIRRDLRLRSDKELKGALKETGLTGDFYKKEIAKKHVRKVLDELKQEGKLGKYEKPYKVLEEALIEQAKEDAAKVAPKPRVRIDYSPHAAHEELEKELDELGSITHSSDSLPPPKNLGEEVGREIDERKASFNREIKKVSDRKKPGEPRVPLTEPPDMDIG